MDVEKLVLTREYQESKLRIRGFRARVEKAGQEELIRLISEKAAFFSGMAKKDPDLYEAFRLEEKQITEAIHKKLTGKEITID